MKRIWMFAAGLALLFMPLIADAGSGDKKVWGGGKQGASSYTDKIVPAVIEQLEKARLGGYQWAGQSEGTGMNAQMVTENPTHLAVGQLDILQDMQANGEAQFTILHENIGPECLYAVTKNPNYTTWGHILANAWDISIATGGAQSGSYGTWTRKLVPLYPDLEDTEIMQVGGADKIIRAVANGSATFGFFVMRPDPASAIFKAIADNKLTLVPVVDFDLEADGTYEFKNLKVAYGGLLSKAAYHTTACTSVALITGDPANATGKHSKRLDATIKRVGGISEGQMLEAVAAQFGGSWRDMLDGFKDVGADTLKLAMEKSKQAAAGALDAASDAVK